MIGNGTRYTEDKDEDWRPLIRGSYNAEVAIPALAKAADALLNVGTVLEGMASGLNKIGVDTARAISDTVELKRHLKNITEREQVVQREFKEVLDREHVFRCELEDLRKRVASLKPKQQRKVLRRKAKTR